MGAGSVGSAIGGYLSKNHDVLLVGRGAHMEAVGRQGLSIQGILGSSHHKPLACDEVDLGGHTFLAKPVDVIFLTVKSPSTVAAAHKLLEVLPDPVGPIWVHIQNGMGNYEAIQEAFRSSDLKSRPLLLSGMTITGYEIPEPGSVNITVYGGPGKIGSIAARADSLKPHVSGSADDSAKELVELLSETPLVFEYTDQMISYLWAKLLYNCCLNPLGALLKVPYGKLRVSPALDLMKDILTEAFSLAREEQVPLFWASPEEYFEHLLGTLIPATTLHEPSMLADMEKGRPTEILAMNGFIAERSKIHGLESPVNSTIVRLIQSASMKNT